MSHDPSAIVARVPFLSGSHAVRIERLSGLTNVNYLITAGDEQFVLRINGPNTTLLGIDRGQEHAIMMAAAHAGIAPEVMFVVEPEGHFITRYVHGRSWSREEFRQPEVMRRAAERIRHIHSLPPIGDTFSLFRTVEYYTRVAQDHGLPFPANFKWLMGQMSEIERAEVADPVPPRLCHNDLVRTNWLDDGSVRILDWEYAGMGNTYFDLATVVYENRLQGELLDRFLTCYLGVPSAQDYLRLRRMQQMFLLREAVWALVQAISAEVTFDFRRYASTMFSRLTDDLLA